MTEVELAYYNEQTASNNSYDYSAYDAENEVDGIHVLVNMAKTGKIDPWNIDIADVADKYLLRLFDMKDKCLRKTGRFFVFAAILLKLKSNILEGIDICQFEDKEDIDEFDDNFENDFDFEEEHIQTNNVISLEEVLQRRTSIRLNRNRVVTLKELIRQLEFYEDMEKKRELKNKLARAHQRVRSYAKFTAEDIINLSRESYIENGIAVLQANLEKIFENEERVELNTLTLLGLDKVSAYMALLFLAVETDYEIEQEEFYADLYFVKAKNHGKEEVRIVA